MTHAPFPTRRHFLKLSGISLATAPLLAGAPLFRENTVPSAAPPLRIREVIDLIIGKIPGGRLENTVDTFKSGKPQGGSAARRFRAAGTHCHAPKRH